MISTVLFDLDDTLVDVSRAARTAVVPWAAELGVAGTPDEIVRRWAAISQPHYRRYQRREVTFAQQRRARVRELAAHLDLTHDDAADTAFAATSPATRRTGSASTTPSRSCDSCEGAGCG